MGMHSTGLIEMNELTPIAAILVEARWRARDVLSRKERSIAIELIAADAAELALSPAPSDQMLSVALTAAAEDAGAGRDILAATPMVFASYDDDLERGRMALRRDIFRGAPDAWPEALKAAEEFVASLIKAPIAGKQQSTEYLAQLQCALRLQKLLWDHPRIPATPTTRLAMFFSIPLLCGVLQRHELRVEERRPPRHPMFNLLSVPRGRMGTD